MDYFPLFLLCPEPIRCCPSGETRTTSRFLRQRPGRVLLRGSISYLTPGGVNWQGRLRLLVADMLRSL